MSEFAILPDKGSSNQFPGGGVIQTDSTFTWKAQNDSGYYRAEFVSLAPQQLLRHQRLRRGRDSFRTDHGPGLEESRRAPFCVLQRGVGSVRARRAGGRIQRELTSLTYM